MPAKLNEGHHRVVVAAIIENERGEYLAAQRPEGKWGAGKWEFPGGKVERGETPRGALTRECREELGIEITPGPVVEALTFSYPDRTDDLLLLFIRCTHAGGEVRGLDNQQFRWVSPKAALELDWLDADWPIIRQLAGQPTNLP